MAEVFAGYLLLDAAITAPRWKTLVGISTVSGLLLWTHYWSMWLLGAIGVLALVRLARAQRRGDRVLVVGTAKIVAALAVGGLTFVPWLPTLLYQSQHTGTPWAPSFRVTTLVVTSITEFAGGPYSEAQLGVLLLTILVAIGVFGTGIDNQRIELDFFAHPLARRPLSVLALTIAIAAAVGMVNGMAFSPRYAAVFFPFFLILVALGLQQFKGGLVRDVVLVTFTALSLAGMFLVVRVDRTQARASVEVIERTASDGVVIACPDQLGPSVSRYLDRERYDITTYPRFASPELVDWVDYKARNERNDPVAFAQELLRRAEGRPLFLVYRDDFLTLKGQCQRVHRDAVGGSAAPDHPARVRRRLLRADDGGRVRSGRTRPGLTVANRTSRWSRDHPARPRRHGVSGHEDPAHREQEPIEPAPPGREALLRDGDHHGEREGRERVPTERVDVVGGEGDDEGDCGVDRPSHRESPGSEDDHHDGADGERGVEDVAELTTGDVDHRGQEAGHGLVPPGAEDPLRVERHPPRVEPPLQPCQVADRPHAGCHHRGETDDHSPSASQVVEHGDEHRDRDERARRSSEPRGQAEDDGRRPPLATGPRAPPRAPEPRPATRSTRTPTPRRRGTAPATTRSPRRVGGLP
ncbi:MAG: hypothetical protein V9G12_12705 [Microthrixaceae bacterium]